VSSDPASRPLRNFTRREYDKMIDAGIVGGNEHVELINGFIVQMSPEGACHSGTIDLCAEAIRRAFGSAYTVRIQHPVIVDPDAEPEPDLAVVQGGPRDHLNQHPSHPVLVVEVADSSLAYDRRDKALLYARAGFPDYWIVNLVDQCVEIFRDPEPAGYRTVVLVTSGSLISPLEFPATQIAVADLLP
jgi:Uma2 family endonuclease